MFKVRKLAIHEVVWALAGSNVGLPKNSENSDNSSSGTLGQANNSLQGSLTQCARIRVPVVSMKIEKFKDLFRAALDRWLDTHESKNFGFGHTRWLIRPIFSAILPILGKI